MGKQSPSHTTFEEAGPSVINETIQDKIRQVAYRLFCECGCEQGHDLEHWLEAERLVPGRLEEK